ncbi:MAG: tectonin domain-containing protein [Cyanobacteriota bacterium]
MLVALSTTLLVVILPVILVLAPSASVAQSTKWCECTEYVASRFGLSGYPHAGDWDNGYLARNGFHQINSPQNGAIVVLNPNTAGAFGLGHVGVVESYATVGNSLRLNIRGTNQPGAKVGNEYGCNNVTIWSNNTNVISNSGVTYWASNTEPYQKDIGIGANGSTWVTGFASTPGGYGVYNWDGARWIKVEGGAVGVSVQPDGIPWVVNDAGEIFRRVSNSWERIPGCAKDIGMGANGSTWVIGCDSTPGGYGIHNWNGADWIKPDGGAVRISVQPDGTPWVVNNAGEIFRRVNNSWERIPGCAKDIGIGANGSTWVIGCDSTPGGYGIHNWNGADWIKPDGGAVRISVQPDGVPWIVNDAGEIFRRVNNSWQRMQ